MNRLKSFALLFAVLSLSVAGCSQGPKFGDVTGQVTLDGKPIENGIIRFFPIDGNTGAGSSAVTKGQYAAKHVPVNKFRVEINASNVPAAPVEGTVYPEIIPVRYNAQSELTAEVAEGSNQKDFSLVSK
jgi:hypothetical protein